MQLKKPSAESRKGGRMAGASKLLKSGVMYMVMDGGYQSLNSALGVSYAVNSKESATPLGCWFVALYYKRKFAAEMARKWRNARVVKVRVAEEEK
jgi:hypothetical protein